MDKAINAVLNEGMSIRRASEHYAIPKSTLGDRISGRVLPGSKSGPRHNLNDEEEEELVTFYDAVPLWASPNHGKSFWHLSRQWQSRKEPSTQLLKAGGILLLRGTLASHSELRCLCPKQEQGLLMRKL